MHIVLNYFPSTGMSKPALQDMILFPFHSILGALFAAGVHHRACAECIYVHRKGTLLKGSTWIFKHPLILTPKLPTWVVIKIMVPFLGSLI